MAYCHKAFSTSKPLDQTQKRVVLHLQQTLKNSIHTTRNDKRINVMANKYKFLIIKQYNHT